MRAADIEKLVSVGRPTIAPDGSFAIFATSRPDVRANRQVGQLWRVALPSGPARRLTQGTADSGPRLSPDGGRVAFRRVDAKGTAQLFVVDAGGGEPVQATDAALGVADFTWTSDGESLVFTARVPERGRYGDVEGLDAAAEAPRRITGIRWHANGLGYIADRPSHVFVVAAPATDAEPLYAAAPAVPAEATDGSDGPDGPRTPDRPVVRSEPRQLTEGTASHSCVAVVGGEVLTIVDEIEHDRRDLRTRVIAIALDESGTREVLGIDAGLVVGDIAVADDGAVAVLAQQLDDGVFVVAANTSLWLLDPDGPRRLTDPETTDLGEVGSHITPVSDDFFVQDRTRGRVRLLRVTRSAEVAEVLSDDVDVTGHDAVRIDGGGDRVVAAVGTAESFGELAIVDGGAVRTLTAFSREVAASGIVTPREVTITARDGSLVHGWVARPVGEGPFPVIVNIHGGPYAAYGIRLFDETQVLVDAGYAVAYCNPRGSAGYGADHGRSIRRAMGTVDMTDVLDFLDAVVADDGDLDGSRVGIMGGSYGGYLTAWTIAHDHRFAGAIVERGFLEPESFLGTSDIGSFFGTEYVGESAEDIARQSPMAAVGSVTTPTLVMHSELDFRCPLEQATRYYSALKRQGIEAEMLIFPGEDHELSRSGAPRHRLERFEAILDWWERKLPIAR